MIENSPQQATVVELRWMYNMVMLTPLLMMDEKKESEDEDVQQSRYL